MPIHFHCTEWMPKKGTVTRLPRHCDSIPDRRHNYFISKATRPALGPNQPRIQYVAWGSRPKRKTSHLHPLQTVELFFMVYIRTTLLCRSNRVWGHSKLVPSLQVFVSASLPTFMCIFSADFSVSIRYLGMGVTLILNKCCVELHNNFIETA
jgi:hypothetical protein